MTVDADPALEQRVGYVLKQAANALRAAMDVALRPLGLTVAQYACLEHLGTNPGLSNADLARRVFVSRQSMNLVLRGLQDRDLVVRPATAPLGRVRPSRLTSAGEELLRSASGAVRDVELRMLAPFDAAGQARLRDDLARAAAAVAGGDCPAG